MKNKVTKKIFIYIFILFSLMIIIYSVLFIVSQHINIKYYFDDYLPNGNANSIPICQKKFIFELILYAKILIFYALYGLILSLYYLKKR